MIVIVVYLKSPSMGGDSYAEIFQGSPANDLSVKTYEELMGNAIHKLLQ